MEDYEDYDVKIDFDKRDQIIHDESELASRGQRLMASFVDSMITGFALLLVYFDDSLAIISLILLLVILIYDLIILVNDGQTIGKKIVGIKIVDYVTGKKSDFSHVVFLRGILTGLISAIPLIGNLMSVVDVLFIFGSEKRCLHDYIAGTKVILNMRFGHND